MRRLLPILVLLALSACIYPYTQEIPQEEKEMRILVVYGDMIFGEESSIALSFVTPLGDYSRKNVICDGPVVLTGHKSSTPGKYVNKRYVFDTRNLSPDDEYKLSVSYGGNVYETPFMKVQPAPEITNLDYTVDETNVNIRISLDGGAELSDFRWDYTETWEYHALFVPDLMYVPGQNSELPSKIYRKPTAEEDYYYCWNSKDGIEPCTASTSGQSENRIKDMAFLSIQRSNPRMSVLYSILVTARGLSPEGRAYIEYLNSTSNITGDLFTPLPSHMNGNIRCVTDSTRLAVGFVEMTRATSKRIFISYEGVYRNNINPDLYLYYPEYDEEEHAYHFEDLYKAGDAPVFCDSEMVPKEPTKTNVRWAPKWCSDCRESGGNKNKPEWWPNNHK